MYTLRSEQIVCEIICKVSADFTLVRQPQNTMVPTVGCCRVNADFTFTLSNESLRSKSAPSVCIIYM